MQQQRQRGLEQDYAGGQYHLERYGLPIIRNALAISDIEVVGRDDLRGHSRGHRPCCQDAFRPHNHRGTGARQKIRAIFPPRLYDGISAQERRKGGISKNHV